MCRKISSTVLVALLIVQLITAPDVNAGGKTVWRHTGRGIKDTDMRIVAVDPSDHRTIYAASLKTVYKSVDEGETWKDIFKIRGEGGSVNAVVPGPTARDRVYVCTGDGVFRSTNKGSGWKRIFGGINSEKGSVLSLAVMNGEILYAGTMAGLFYTENGGRDWKRGLNMLFETTVYSITIDKHDGDIIYAATDRGIYKSLDRGSSWKRTYEARDHIEDSVPLSGEYTDTGVAELTPSIGNISVAPEKKGVLYASSSWGLLISKDRGVSWKNAGSMGLFSRRIRHAIPGAGSSDIIYAATDKGVFMYSKSAGSWDGLHKGMNTTNVRYLAAGPADADGSPGLWAATERGLFMLVRDNTDKTAVEIKPEFEHEPTIQEVREAAIEYADVHPEKIRRWRKAASRSAWLPDVRAGFDSNNDWQSSNYFYSTSKEKYVDDDITEGRDSGWSVSLTWRLGDLIWNNDQTSIDSRSRYAVQLRDDILNEVTRLYFERRRLQIEMMMSEPVNTMEGIEQDLRLQELTANIDALTGAYFSRRLGSSSHQ